MEKTLFNMKFTSKQLARQSKKCEKNEKIQKKKALAAMKKNNAEGAKIYAGNAIREKNQSLNFLRLSSRIDAVASRVEMAIRTNALTKSMSGVVKGMDKVLAGMNAEHIASTMEKFEKQFEDLDVTAGYMEGAIESSTAVSTPADQVTNLLQQVADEAGLEIGGMLPEAGMAPISTTATEAPAETNLQARLEALRGGGGV